MESSESKDQTFNGVRKFQEDNSMSTSVELKKSEEDSEDSSGDELTADKGFEIKSVKIIKIDDRDKSKRRKFGTN